MEAIWKFFKENCKKCWEEREMISLHRPIFVAFGIVVFLVTAGFVGIVSYSWFSSTIASRDAEIRIKNATIENLKNTSVSDANVKKDRSAIMAQLQSFYIEAAPFEATLFVKQNEHPDEFKKNYDEALKWEQRTEQWIKDNLGEAARIRFIDMSDIQGGAFAGYSLEQASTIHQFRKVRQNLRILIESSVWDRP